MNENELFCLALGLAAPWFVKSLEFSAQKKRLDIHLDFPKGSRFPCPDCGRECGVYDTQEREWRHLDFFQHETYLHARQPRIECPDHKVKTVEAPWARPGSGFTLLFEAMVLIMTQRGMTVKAVGDHVGEYDTRIWRVLESYVCRARKHVDMAEVKQVGVDETSRTKGHRYVTVFMDLDKRSILYATEGKDAETVKAFRTDLQEHGGNAKQIQEFSLDMSPAFQRGIQENFPQAQITFDQFHLMKLMNQAVDEVRREEQKAHPELKGSRYVWLTNEWNLSQKQKKLYESLRSMELKTNKAHFLKSVFQDIFSCEKEDGEALLKRWYYWATHSRLIPVIKFARTIKAHWDGVVRWFQSKINNGLLEGTNSRIQTAKSRSRGFRNVRYFITMIYLIGGKLDFQLPEVFHSTHTK